MTRHLITSAGTSGVTPYTRRVTGLLRSVPREQGLFSGLLLRKDDGSRRKRIMDTRNCEDMDKHICTEGDQPWKQGCGTKMLRHYTTGCRMRRKRIWSTNMIRVRMWVQGLGRGWAAVCGAAGLGCFAVMAQSWTNCVGVVELSAAAVQGCMRRD